MVSTVTVQPLIEPVTLQRAKSHLNMEGDLDDAFIDFAIKSARQTVEVLTGRALMTTTFQQLFTCFDEVMLLDKHALQSVTSVTYIDTDGNSQTLPTASYDVDTNTAAIRLAFGAAWPSTRAVYNAVTVTYKAGYGDKASDVPEPLNSAILLIVGHLDCNREATSPLTIKDVPMGVTYLINGYKVYQ